MRENVMMVKKMSLFLLLFVVGCREIDIRASEAPCTEQKEQPDVKKTGGKKTEGRGGKGRERRVVFQFEAMYEKFLKCVSENELEYTQARMLCEKVGNCDECPRFQKADEEKEFYDTKVQLIKEANRFHELLYRNGIENGFDRQRTIRKIVN